MSNVEYALALAMVASVAIIAIGAAGMLVSAVYSGSRIMLSRLTLPSTYVLPPASPPVTQGEER